MNWNQQEILKVINVVMTKQNSEYNDVNKELGEYFGITPNAVVCSRVSIMRCLQGFEPSSEKGDKKGYNFGKTFTEVVNDWFKFTYEGGLSRNALAIKFN